MERKFKYWKKREKKETKLTPWSRILLKMLNPQLPYKFLIFHRILRLITAFAKAQR
jgi:hypothetical protein